MKEKKEREISIEELLGYLWGFRLELMYIALSYQNKANKWKGDDTTKIDLHLKGLEHIAEASQIQDTLALVIDI